MHQLIWERQMKFCGFGLARAFFMQQCRQSIVLQVFVLPAALSC